MNKGEARTKLNRFLKPLYEQFGSKTSLLTKFGRWHLEDNPEAQTDFAKAILDNKHKWKSLETVIESGKPFISFHFLNQQSRNGSWIRIIETNKIGYLYNVGEEKLDYIMLRRYTGNSGSQYFLNISNPDFGTMNNLKLAEQKINAEMWFKMFFFDDFEEYILIEDLVDLEIPFLNWQSDSPLEVKE